MSRTGVVIIGRNEGENLRRCIGSVRDESVPVVYVDSGSTDGSVDLARAMGCHVVELDAGVPFTAARARNTGFEHVLGLHRDLEFVQFVDGDCELSANWLAGGEVEFSWRPDVGVVFGRLGEQSPEASIYNRLCEMEWKGSTGEVKSCGGIFMARVRAFREAGGFNPAIRAGEEPELCVRLRQGGWKILRVDAPMALHDAGMTSFGQWARRAIRSGHAYAEGAALHFCTPGRHWLRQVGSILLWGVAVPAVAVTSVAVAPWTPWTLSLIGLIAAAYAVLALRIYRSRRRLHDRPKDAALYTLFCILSKWPQCWGLWTYLGRRLRRERSLAPTQEGTE